MSAEFTVEDPGAGNLGEVSALSKKLLSLSEDVGTLVYTLRSMAGELNSTWTGEAAIAARDKAAGLADNFDALGLPLYEGSVKVAQYESLVEDIDGRAKPLKAKLAELRDVRDNLSLGLFEAKIYAEGGSAYVSSVGPSTSYDTASQHLTAAGKAAAKRALNARKADLTAEIGTAEPQSGVLGQLAALFHERQGFEAFYGAALEGLIPEALQSSLISIQVASGQDTSATVALFSNPEEFLILAAGLSPAELRKLMKEHPQLAEKLHRADPAFVYQWWTTLNDDQRKDLIDTIPADIGSLDGIPPLDRVAANKENAKTLIDENNDRIKELEEQAAKAGQPYGGQGKGVALQYPLNADDVRTPSEIREEIERLKKENSYLKQAAKGDVQLYLYDRDNDRIVEMLGTPGPETTNVITYVPGTFAGMDGFYDQSTQEVSKYLLKGENAVVFVYKDGSFPGTIPQANEIPFGLDAGAKLAAFEESINLDPNIANARQSAVGHSWGTANITSSEVAGAHYDQVISISGAWMPPAWDPNPTTSYTDYSDYDLLQQAQQAGAVGNGRNPRDEFDYGPYYEGPGDIGFDDAALSAGLGLVNPLLGIAVIEKAMLDNHNNVATADEANVSLLNDVKRKIFG